jgi:hypothetical protein
MSADELLFACRRFKKCREKLPAADLYRDETGKLVCRQGLCPNGKNLDQQTALDLQIQLRKQREQTKAVTAEREQLIDLTHSLEDRLQVALEIRDITKVPAIEAFSSITTNEAVPILLCSDWHCGAVVKPETVNGLNAYDVDTFHERAAALFRNTLKVVRMVRFTSDIKRIVVWLGGDLIDNQIHPEQVQTQELSPTQQLIECERSIVAGLDYLLANGEFDEIIVPCSYGNHGRTTVKMQADNAHATSYEWLMYQSLQRHYRNTEKIKFCISDGNILYLDVLGQKLRFHHGDAIKYGGGVGGITVPLQKWVYRQDVGIRADHSFFGHFHQLTLGQNWSVNGSLIGATAYGLKLGFPPERPQQLLRFIDRDRGFTVSAPVLTD